jgi:hypothetical protein
MWFYNGEVRYSWIIVFDINHYKSLGSNILSSQYLVFVFQVAGKVELIFAFVEHVFDLFVLLQRLVALLVAALLQ